MDLPRYRGTEGGRDGGVKSNILTKRRGWGEEMAERARGRAGEVAVAVMERGEHGMGEQGANSALREGGAFGAASLLLLEHPPPRYCGNRPQQITRVTWPRRAARLCRTKGTHPTHWNFSSDSAQIQHT